MIVKTYKTTGDSNTEILTGIGYNYFKTLAAGRNFVVISDQNLLELYPDAFDKTNYIIIKAGEENKNLNTVEQIIEKLIEYKIDRKSLIVGFGGGLVSDITGFVANVYMRGTAFGFVATTLLAQIDAAIGGKNGVNFGKFKNYIGNIAQPEFVICDTSVFKTLKEEDFMSGLGEVIKYSLISEGTLFDYVKANLKYVLKRDKDVLNQIVRRCIDIKTEIVVKDPGDKGLRHILNFGHTIGHSIEIVNKLPHGVAVVKGILASMDLAVKMGYSETDVRTQVLELISIAGFETDYKLDERHFELLANDKKKSGDMINFVFLLNIGEPLVVKINTAEIIDSFVK